MSTIDPTRLLMELRSLAAEAQRTPALGAGNGVAASGSATGAPDFGALLKESLNQVNSLQQSSAELSTAFEQGQPGLDITRVMVEAQKATLAFRAMTEVRNRLVTAYQDVMNMAI
jgi:flagellar hook-basal body complex protein FliE